MIPFSEYLIYVLCTLVSNIELHGGSFADREALWTNQSTYNSIVGIGLNWNPVMAHVST